MAEGARLESVFRGNSNVGSNPTLSASFLIPGPEYGARTTRLELLRAGLFATDRTDQVLTLSSGKPFDWMVEQSTATARFQLEKGEERWLVLRYDDDDIHPVDRYESGRKLLP